MAEEKQEEAQSLVYAPTWAVAAVCFVFIVFSLLVELIILAIERFWRSRKQIALLEALEKIKEELMLVGFISLALNIGQTYVLKICIPKEWTHVMRQCKVPKGLHERQDASAGTLPYGQRCSDKGKADFISLESLHQLHIFLFSLAVVHVVYSVVIMVLGMLKVRQWRAWEEMSNKMASANSHGGLRFTKDTTFIKRHVTGVWSKNVILAHIAAFFRQFYQSVSRTDYFTLRHGFIRNHNLQNFNFHNYIVKSLEKDFKHVVGISPPLWGYMVLVILLNIEGWGMLYWTALLPFVMVLTVGTKLRYIITRMAVQCLDKHAVVEGLPAVKPSDHLFWFERPTLILSLIHFISFQDAFEVAVHLWSRLTFGKPNCLNQRHYLVVGRLILGFVSQVLCGYVVLPIYALVSQMGSQMKEHKDMELCVSNMHEDNNGNLTRVYSSKEGIDLVAADSMIQLHGANIHNRDTTGECDEDSIVEVNENLDGGPCIQRKMSFVEKVARGVHGEDYYELKSSTTQSGEALSKGSPGA